MQALKMLYEVTKLMNMKAEDHENCKNATVIIEAALNKTEKPKDKK